MILVSACLLGIDCKYNGKNNYNKDLKKFLKDKKYIIVCPEQLGGLPTPRKPSEIIAGDGYDVLDGKKKVLNLKGDDVTDYFIKGAYESLKIAKLYGIKKAILKARSPSCASFKIYDGSFSGKLREGVGVTTALLKKNGIKVLNEENYREYIE
ncbi:DUF523 domain-containing protein [Caminicella sporogenes]|uniref:DUF523 domain-containing protein n=1 Tax=Caminicella sporogenes TaxID=166485 RepID=UPI0025409AD2|nr:DUF523 domain-containing protein [Caminicella sporogenes]WIF94278.1 DUF523 domain-containing protein [Caminicella sporogenes]